MDLSGHHAKVLFSSALDENDGYPIDGYFVDLSPNRKRALMVRITRVDTDNANETLYVADVRGRGGRAVMSTSDSTPVGLWSPDGARFFYYTAVLAPSSCSFAFWSAAPDGSDAQRLGSGLSFTWGPDHHSFATIEGCVVGDQPGRVVYTDRSGTSHVISNNAAFGGFSISPRGDRIAYTTYAADSSWDLHIARTDGSGDLESIPNAFSPAWSPDGRRVAFIRPWRNGGYTGSLALASADGTNVRTVVPWGKDKRGLPAYAVSRPTWSPDGRRIAYFSGGLNPVNALETIRPDGRGNRVVVRGDLVNLWWAPDSRHIYYDGTS